MKPPKQKHPKTRAPRGNPHFTKQLSCLVTEKQWRKFHKRGGSAWLRKLIDDAP